MPTISEQQVPLAAEDRFLIVSIRKAEALCPHIDDAAALGEAIELAKPFLGGLIPLFDLRGLPQVYNDVDSFISEVASSGAHVLVNPATARTLDLDDLFRRRGYHVLSVTGQSYHSRAFDLADFRGSDDITGCTDPIGQIAYELLFKIFADQVGDRDPEDLMRSSSNEELDRLPSLEHIQQLLTPKQLSAWIRREYRGKVVCGISPQDFARSIQLFLPRIHAGLSNVQQLFEFHEDADMVSYYLRSALLHAFLRRLHRNSLLVEFVMSTDGESIACAPYHGSALNEVEFPSKSNTLVGRPATLAHKTRAMFSEEISQFEALLNTTSTRERHIQRFLERHPNFLKGLNYSSIYPQLVLQRSDGTSLRPDFVLEPFDDEWCDILDLKLPTQSIIVGRNDRSTLAAGIHEVAAQLREYAAYFEQDRYRKWVWQKYGIRVYRPRLIAIVGRDIRQMNEAEIRRTMTAYADLRIMTFDQLVAHAKQRILI